MFEVSDKEGHVIAIIGERESISKNKAMLMIEAGYTVKEVSFVFDVSEARVISLCNLVF